MMELDELKTKWEEHSRRLEANLLLNRELLLGLKLGAAEKKLQRSGRYAAVEAAVWLVIAGALGNFIAVHIERPALAFSAAALDLLSIGMIVALIRQSVAASHIDFAQPIAAIQRQVEILRILRIRTTVWSLLCGTLLWVPCVAVVSQAMLGVDFYESANTLWLIVNLLFGLALFPLASWLSKKYQQRFDRSPILQRFMNDLAGNNLNAAKTSLAELQQFETA